MFRKLNLDILRIFACFFVIYQHTCSILVNSTSVSKTYIIAMIYLFITKTAVPLFLMISGAVLLGKSETYKDIFHKRIFKVICVIILFSLFYNYSFNSSNLIDFFKLIYTTNITNAFWYLYLYLGILLLLPLLRKLNFGNKDYMYLLVLYIIFQGTLPFLNYYFSFPLPSDKISVAFFSTYVLCFILGYYLEKILDKKYYNKTGAIAAWIVIIIDLMFSLFCVLYELRLNGKTNLNAIYFINYHITTMLLSICIFYLCKYYCNLVYFPDKIRNSLIIIGKSTFGIYLLSDFYIRLLNKLYLYYLEKFNLLLAILIFDVIVFTIGLITTTLLKKIPLLKNLL